MSSLDQWEEGIPWKYPCEGIKEEMSRAVMNNLQKLREMDNLVPTLFHEIYKKCFGMCYDAALESTWHWLTNQHICDFPVPTYTRDDLPQPCITMRKGHRPKMFLWMMEEYMYIWSKLPVDDRDGQMVLAHELLLLACSRCCRKRGGGQGPHHVGAQPLDSLPACSRDTIECAACPTKDTIASECLAWAMYDNQLELGKPPSLSGMESYGQVLWCLVDKVFQGLQAHCLTCTSAMFKSEKEQVKSVVTVPQKPPWPERYSMMIDVQKEFMRDN